MIDRRSFLMGLAAAGLTAVTGGACSRRARFSRSGLDAFVREGSALGVRGVVVRASGETIVSQGDVTTPSRIASIRKSFLSALFGIAAAERRADLDATLGELGLDDYVPLTEGERRATVRHLLQGRSGVYLPSSAESAVMKAGRPPRGSHAPGTFWYYNNWDFNALGEIYQRVTGEGLFTALEHRLTRPLGFEDFVPVRDTAFLYDAASPRFPAYTMAMSPRDMARFAQMFLDGGRQGRRQIVPSSWVAESTRAHSQTTGELPGFDGFGYLWWVATGQQRAVHGIPGGSFTAAGYGGRYITVLPALDTVVAIQPHERQGEPPARLYAEKKLASLLRILIDAARS